MALIQSAVVVSLFALVSSAFADPGKDIQVHCGPKVGEGFQVTFTHGVFPPSNEQYTFSAILVSIRRDDRAQILEDFESADEPVVVVNRREMLDFLQGKIEAGDSPIFAAKNGVHFSFSKKAKILTVRGHKIKDGTYRCGALK
jgi:hypothetical protein